MDIIKKVISPSIFGKERKKLPNLGRTEVPKDTIQCYTCRYAIEGPYGYRNGNCYKYKKTSGKPNGILFDDEKCRYYRKDRPNNTRESK